MSRLGKIWTGAVAYVSLLVGAGLSVAGNLADTYRTRGADIDNLDKIMAAAWPILVILAIEMFVSPRWSPKPMFQVWRWVGCLAVGGMAMVVSWTHLHDLMSARGQLVVVAVLGPLAIDGMAIMATGLILSTRVRGQERTAADTARPVAGDPMTADMATVMDTLATGQHMTADAPGPDLSVSADRQAGIAPDADTDTRTGHDRWSDLVDSTDMAKLNGMATWAQWTPADDRAVADMAMDTLPKRVRAAAGQSYPAEFADLATAWVVTRDGPSRPDVVKLLSAHLDVSERTVRRWLAAFTGQPVSGPPSEES